MNLDGLVSNRRVSARELRRKLDLMATVAGGANHNEQVTRKFVEDLETRVAATEAALAEFFGLSLWGRLKWVCTGKPFVVEGDDVREAEVSE